MDITFFEPRISVDTAAFWEGCKGHKLLFQKCHQCGRLRWPAAYLCPECLSNETELVEAGSEGTIHSYVVFHKAFHPSLKDKVPYITATVDMEGGIRIVTNIVECEPDKVSCGAKVRLKWCEAENFTRPVFIIAED